MRVGVGGGVNMVPSLSPPASDGGGPGFRRLAPWRRLLSDYFFFFDCFCEGWGVCLKIPY